MRCLPRRHLIRTVIKVYLSYEEYTGMGGGVSQSAYPRLEARARAQLDRMTFGRIKGEEPVRENVKYCMFDLIGAMEAEEGMGSMAAGREIASMSNDGVSVTFASGGSGSARAAAARYAAIARDWLADETAACGVPLLYARVGMI